MRIAAVFHHDVALYHHTLVAALVNAYHRRAQFFQFLHGFCVAGTTGRIQCEPVADFLVLRPVDHLPEADVGGNVVGVTVGEPGAKLRTPAAADDEDLVLMKFLAQPQYELVRVIGQPLDGERLRRGALVRAAAPTLVPGHDGEGVQKVGVLRDDAVPVADPGAAM